MYACVGILSREAVLLNSREEVRERTRDQMCFVLLLLAKESAEKLVRESEGTRCLCVLCAYCALF